MMARFTGIKASVLQFAQTWHGLPRSLWLLISARAVNQVCAFTLPFLTVLLTRKLQVSIVTAGVFVAIFGFATIPGRLLGGKLADQVGRRSTMVMGLLITATAQLGISMLSSRDAAAAWLVVLGLAFEIYEPPHTQALVADLVDAAGRPAAYGLYSAVLAVAGVFAGLIATIVGHVGLNWLFVADAATCIAAATLLGLMLKEPPSRKYAAKVEAQDERLASCWRDPALVTMLVTGTAFAVLYMQIAILTPLTLAVRHIPPSNFGILVMASALTIIAGQPLLRRRENGIDPFKAMSVSYLLMGAGLVVYGLAHSMWEFTGATLLWSIGDLIILGRATAIVASIAPESARGKYMSIYGLSWGVAIIIGPLVGTQLLQHWGVLSTWATIAAACALLALVQPIAARMVNSHTVNWPLDSSRERRA